jgi:hypothetical protein
LIHLFELRLRTLSERVVFHFHSRYIPSNDTTNPTLAMAIDEYPPYTPMPSLGHELGLMFGFLSLCIVAMVAYIALWRGELSFHSPLHISVYQSKDLQVYLWAIHIKHTHISIHINSNPIIILSLTTTPSIPNPLTRPRPRPSQSIPRQKPNPDTPRNNNFCNSRSTPKSQQGDKTQHSRTRENARPYRYACGPC